MPVDLAELDAIGLTPVQSHTLVRLWGYIWRYGGALPSTAKERADIAGIHVRTWSAMEARLEPHFDIDEQGRWRHVDLEEKVEGRLKRARVNKQNADARWAREGEDGDTSSDANGNASRIPNPADEGSENGRFGMRLATPGASSAGGQSDGQTCLQPKEKIEETDARTDAPQASGAGAGDAGRTASSAREGSNLLRLSAGKIAIDDASGTARPDASGNTGSDAKAATDPPPDAEIARILREGAGDKIPAHLLTPDGLAPIRVLMSEGCDFLRDVAPAFIAGARGLKRPLDSLRAGFLRDGALANRDAAVALEAAAAPKATLFFITPGMPEWDAWLKHEKRKSFPLISTRARPGGPKGWFVRAQWPPGETEQSIEGRGGAPP